MVFKFTNKNVFVYFILWWFWFGLLLIVANRKTNWEARQPIVCQLLETHSQLLSNLRTCLLECLNALLMRAPRTHTEGLTLLCLADPDNAALLYTIALLETDNLVLVVHELLVLLEIRRPMPNLVQSCLVAQNETLVAVCDILSMEALDVLQIIGDVSG